MIILKERTMLNKIGKIPVLTAASTRPSQALYIFFRLGLENLVLEMVGILNAYGSITTNPEKRALQGKPDYVELSAYNYYYSIALCMRQSGTGKKYEGCRMLLPYSRASLTPLCRSDTISAFSKEMG